LSIRDLIHSALNVPLKIESAAPSISYATNGAVFTWGAMTFNEITMVIATSFAVATYFTSLYFQRRRDRREQEFHQHRLNVERQSSESESS